MTQSEKVRAPIGKRLIALWFYLSYKLATHNLMQVPLQRWLWIWVFVPPLFAVLGRLSWWLVVLISALGLLALAGTEWARRRDYVIFASPVSEINKASTSPPADRLRIDEPILCWASGTFAVDGRVRIMAGERGRVSYVQTREHIVMAYIWRTRFALLAQAPKDDVGWWYVFFRPGQVCKVRSGIVLCGLTARPGLALVYKAAEETKVAQVYLAFGDDRDRRRLLEDLGRDVAEEAF